MMLKCFGDMYTHCQLILKTFLHSLYLHERVFSKQRNNSCKPIPDLAGSLIDVCLLLVKWRYNSYPGFVLQSTNLYKSVHTSTPPIPTLSPQTINL